MQTKIIEATNIKVGGANWGKFLIGRLDQEWQHHSPVSNMLLLGSIGWSPEHIVVFDLQTGEGAQFLPGGLAAADLHAHRVWVCPMFEPFLMWLYRQDLSDLTALPDVVEIPDPESALWGYRRAGKRRQG